ncbi:MAG TPA: hypothetical protein EYO89_02960 [Candidatus Dadabacteria bacterium]|nr:hypothetical protein [Candidatus Dadabacteria bacterium]
MKIYIGIDPGKSGGMAIYDEKSISAYKCPETEGDMYALFEIMSSKAYLSPITDFYAVIEHVWGFPTDSATTAFKFGKNFGAWLTILQIANCQYNLVTPREWQKFYHTPKMIKKERKQWLKALAGSLPVKYDEETRITYNTADAILIAVYAKEHFQKIDTKSETETKK